LNSLFIMSFLRKMVVVVRVFVKGNKLDAITWYFRLGK